MSTDHQPALAYRCRGVPPCRMLLSYRGVHSCVPACPQCGAVMDCVEEHPRCRCGAYLYLDEEKRPYCPRDNSHGIPSGWTWEPAGISSATGAQTEKRRPCPWCGEFHLAGCTKPGYREFDGR